MITELVFDGDEFDDMMIGGEIAISILEVCDGKVRIVIEHPESFRIQDRESFEVQKAEEEAAKVKEDADHKAKADKAYEVLRNAIASGTFDFKDNKFSYSMGNNFNKNYYAEPYYPKL